MCIFSKIFINARLAAAFLSAACDEKRTLPSRAVYRERQRAHKSDQTSALQRIITTYHRQNIM